MAPRWQPRSMVDMATAETPPVGHLLRDWRLRRRRSQLDLALDTGVSTRHLSCVETGRARPSRALLLKLCTELELPLRERNRLLLAAGLAPQYPEQALDAAALIEARATIELLLSVHEPNPALAVDGHWTLLLANRPAELLLGLVSPELRQPPVNLLRLTLHPQGLAPHIDNLGEWRAAVLSRLRRQAAQSGDPELTALLAELSAWPSLTGETTAPVGPPEPASILATPLRLRTPVGVIALIGTVTVFGTPNSITLAELAIEALFPADAESAARLAALVGS